MNPKNRALWDGVAWSSRDDALNWPSLDNNSGPSGTSMNTSSTGSGDAVSPGPKETNKQVESPSEDGPSQSTDTLFLDVTMEGMVSGSHGNLEEVGHPREFIC